MVFNGKKIRIAFRVDSSTQIGSGHLMRCLTLAAKLEDQAEIYFICRNLENNLNILVKRKKYILDLLSNENENLLELQPKNDAEHTIKILKVRKIHCLIIDHYGIDEFWEKKMRLYVNKIMVIDDLANRRHDCDILLDQNFSSEKFEYYNNLLPPRCKKFMGLEFLLLREEFYAEKDKDKIQDGFKYIMCFFGSGDTKKQTMKMLKSIALLGNDNFRFHIVVGKENKLKNIIKEGCKKDQRIFFHEQITCMAELMRQSDLYVGSAGLTIWECCYMGVPSLIMSTTWNEYKYIKKMQTEKPFIYLGRCEDIDEICLARKIHFYINNPDAMDRLSYSCINIGSKEKLRELINGILI